MFIISAFYHFFDFPGYAEAKPALHAEMTRLGLKGSLLIASEGLNGTLAGTREAIETFLDYLKDVIIKAPFDHKESFCDRQPFARTKVRLKKEIISLGVPVNPKRATGHYVRPEAWNDLIADPDVVVLDARNSYETHLGSFDSAIDPSTRTFKQLPAFVKQNLDPTVHKKVATFCTGGIRCEKLTSWLIQEGFSDVYQLQGGILKYLETIPENESKWQGECYVFDERIAVGHGLVPSQTATQCRACGHAPTGDDRVQTSFDDHEGCRYCSSEERQ